VPNISGINLLVALLPAALLAGCTTPVPAPRASLDPKTGVSLIVVDQPLVLARERRDIAAQARDYLTLVAAEIDEAGHRRLVLAVHQWSTIDSRTADVHPLVGADLLLVADGRDLRFAPLTGAFVAAYAHNPALQRPEDTEVVTTLYEADAETLAYIATCHSLSASFPNSFPLPFMVWKDGRSAISRLLTELGIAK